MVTYDARPSPFTQLSQTQEWEYLCSALNLDDGIDASQSIGSMVPSLDTGGRNAVIGPGNAAIKGQLWRCDASVSTPIPAASAQNRIDRLVLQYNRGASTSPTVIQPFVVTGTPAGSPTEPPLTQTPTGIFQIPICSWTSASSGAISGLVDERQIVADNWHTVTLPTTPTGLSGSWRYKMVEYHMVMHDIVLSWANASGQQWSMPVAPLPWASSTPAGLPRLYANTGNGTLNTGTNTTLPRVYISGPNWQFLSPNNLDNGQAAWTLLVPTD